LNAKIVKTLSLGTQRIRVDGVHAALKVLKMLSGKLLPLETMSARSTNKILTESKMESLFGMALVTQEIK
jgi:hypothetical protein